MPSSARGIVVGLRLAGAAAIALAAAACGGAESAGPAQGAGGELGDPGSGGAGGARETTTSGTTGTTTHETGSGGAGGAGGGKLGAPYPVVLAHGFFGFESFAGADFATYFYEVKEHLAAEGEAVHTPAVDPFNDSDARGAQLVQHIKEILAQTGHAKVNLVGHSQGGLDARAAAALRPDLIASVVTVATPHHGTPIADIALGAAEDPKQQQVLDWIVNVIGAPLYDEVGETTSVSKALYLFSQPGITAFNAAHPDQPGILYASITGRTGNHPGGPSCIADVVLPFVSAWDDTLDPTDAALVLTETILDGELGAGVANDGLVRAEDARWGELWGCIPADHMDEVGQLLGDAPGGSNDWDYLAFYRALIAYLRTRGF